MQLSRLPHITTSAFGVQRQSRVSRPQPQARQICSTVCMAKPTKAAEFRSLSEEEIEKEIYDCQSSLFFARIAQKQRKEFKPDQMKWNQHKIAQLKTVLREREVEKGINKRESRKIQKRKMLAAKHAK